LLLMQRWRPLVKPLSLSRRLSLSAPRRSGLENILASAPTGGVQVNSVSSRGFALADGLFISSACIFLGGRPFLWKVPHSMWDEWGKEHFEVFEITIPKPELLLLGTGRVARQPPPAIRDYLRNIGISIDIMDTRNACSTYNMLAEEGRRVAAALIVPRD